MSKKVLLIEHGCGFIDPNDERNKKFLNEASALGNDNANIKIIEPLRLFVVLQKYDILNKNGRIYPKDVLIAQAEEYNKLIQQGLSLGEAEHPDSTVINSSRVSHGIKKIWFEGQTMVGEIEIIMSPGFVKYGVISCEGDNIANLLRLGYRVGVSSRGVGSVVEKNGALIVQDDFEIICWDIVLNPSTPGSYLFNDRKEATPFMESVVKKENLLENNIRKFLL